MALSPSEAAKANVCRETSADGYLRKYDDRSGTPGQRKSKANAAFGKYA